MHIEESENHNSQKCPERSLSSSLLKIQKEFTGIETSLLFVEGRMKQTALTDRSRSLRFS